MRKQFKLVAFLAALLGLAGVNAKAFHGNATPIGWISGGGTIVLMQGQTYEWVGVFCAEAPHYELVINNASWSVTERLIPFFGSDPKYLGDLKAGESGEYVFTVRYTIRVPNNLTPGLYSGHIAVVGTRNDKQQATRAVVPETLRLDIHVIPAQ